MRASRIAITAWTLLFALLVVGVLALRIHRAARDAAIAVAPAPDPHELPMDYAAPEARSALEYFETFTLGNGRLRRNAVETKKSIELPATLVSATAISEASDF